MQVSTDLQSTQMGTGDQDCDARPNEQAIEWKMLRKFGSRSRYARFILELPMAYVSKLLNKRFTTAAFPSR